MLSREGNPAKDYVSIVAPVYNTNGREVTSEFDFWDPAASLSNRPRYTETGAEKLEQASQTWTGTEWAGIEGDETREGDNCFDWSDGTDGASGMHGLGDTIDGEGWIQTSDSTVCSTERRIYCINGQ